MHHFTVKDVMMSLFYAINKAEAGVPQGMQRLFVYGDDFII